MLAEKIRKLSAAKNASRIALGTGATAFVLVVIADYVTSYELSFSAFYLLIIFSLTWFCGFRWGLLVAILSEFCQFQMGITVGNSFSAPVYFYVSNANRIFAYLLVALLVSIVRTMFDREQSIARIDFLTKLTNRMAFFEQVAREIERHFRDNKPFAVAYLDCDHFKDVNDKAGHAEGDRVLQYIGRTLKSRVRLGDTVARLGGDEFAVVFPNSNESTALRIVHRIHQALDQTMTRNKWPTTFSIGLGIFEKVPKNADDVVAFADTLMFRAKAAGKNRLVHRAYDPDAPEGKTNVLPITNRGLEPS